MYIRPQETGTKSDMRWWNQTTIGGKGIRITSPELFYASATNYTTASLDDGDTKHQRHSQEVEPVDYTILRVDAFHTGLGGIDSLGCNTAASAPHPLRTHVDDSPSHSAEIIQIHKP